MRILRIPIALTFLAAVCLLAVISASVAFRDQGVMAAAPSSPAYTKDGEMLPPTNYREWIYLTSGIDMSYSPKTADMQGQSMFDNVFVNPQAYHGFMTTGTWPDKTVIVMESREARTRGSINQQGHFQGPAGRGSRSPRKG